MRYVFNICSVIILAALTCIAVNAKSQDVASARKIVDEIFSSEPNTIAVDAIIARIDPETAKVVWSNIIDRLDKSFFRYSRNKVLSIDQRQLEFLFGDN